MLISLQLSTLRILTAEVRSSKCLINVEYGDSSGRLVRHDQHTVPRLSFRRRIGERSWLYSFVKIRQMANISDSPFVPYPIGHGSILRVFDIGPTPRSHAARYCTPFFTCSHHSFACERSASICPSYRFATNLHQWFSE